MALPFRRETFIALGARRQGYRIAREIISPHMRPPIEPPQPEWGYALEKFKRERKREAWLAQHAKEDGKKDVVPWIILRSIFFVVPIAIFCLKMAGVIG